MLPKWIKSRLLDWEPEHAWERASKALRPLTVFAALALSLISQATPKRELRVFLPVSTPVDPLYLKSMAEYDCSLMLYRTWMNYDIARKAVPGVVSSWKFVADEGMYRITIGDFKWSDGTSIEATHLVQNLQRIFKSKTTYGRALAKSIDPKSVKALGSKVLVFKTRDGQPNEGLFNQLGSIFLALVHPEDLDKSGTRLKRNSKFSGPYTIAEETSDTLTFKKNPHYEFKNELAPDVVVAKRTGRGGGLEQFIEGKSWENYIQANSFVSTRIAQKIKDSGLPIWTRGADRVMVMRPLGKGTQLSRNRSVLLRWGAAIKNLKISHPLNVRVANSLQPAGYPLFNNVTVDDPKEQVGKKPKVKVLMMDDLSVEIAQDVVNQLNRGGAADVEFMPVAPSEFLGKDWQSFGADFALFSFGVADPEPTTWLGLVFGSKLVEYSPAELKQFESLSGLSDAEKQIEGYRDLLSSIQRRGGYLPLLHGATISLGTKSMNFELVDPLDETVDYSKIKVND